jgi:hypothetical protein
VVLVLLALLVLEEHIRGVVVEMVVMGVPYIDAAAAVAAARQDIRGMVAQAGAAVARCRLHLREAEQTAVGALLLPVAIITVAVAAVLVCSGKGHQGHLLVWMLVDMAEAAAQMVLTVVLQAPAQVRVVYMAAGLQEDVQAQYRGEAQFA